eukprot:CAMPEP_0206060782 /NCGR_PEP_ID=MMETSP1466-20131121/52231_1 /ASSEMBLY_ACC=CAM_ASM_001126 /TAXON_ID=44452 /ORGANISM="Pavlova gyrans, Strain CCMP608" /LENGTH=141 /DNA_ID=CAMNT_0053436123 /DNA_START=34 /DNA_END=456 /DNA_ORIENTATION=+
MRMVDATADAQSQSYVSRPGDAASPIAGCGPSSPHADEEERTKLSELMSILDQEDEERVDLESLLEMKVLRTLDARVPWPGQQERRAPRFHNIGDHCPRLRSVEATHPERSHTARLMLRATMAVHSVLDDRCAAEPDVATR